MKIVKHTDNELVVSDRLPRNLWKGVGIALVGCLITLWGIREHFNSYTSLDCDRSKSNIITCKLVQFNGALNNYETTILTGVKNSYFNIIKTERTDKDGDTTTSYNYELLISHNAGSNQIYFKPDSLAEKYAPLISAFIKDPQLSTLNIKESPYLKPIGIGAFFPLIIGNVIAFSIALRGKHLVFSKSKKFLISLNIPYFPFLKFENIAFDSIKRIEYIYHTNNIDGKLLTALEIENDYKMREYVVLSLLRFDHINMILNNGKNFAIKHPQDQKREDMQSMEEIAEVISKFVNVKLTALN